MSDSDIDPRLGPWEPVTTERLRQLLFPNGPLAWSDGESEQSPASNGVLHQYVDEFEISSSFDGNPWESEWDLTDLLHCSMDANSGTS
jgi:hypothetical protein